MRYPLLLLVLLAISFAGSDTLHAQAQLPRAGQNFTFGVIEGPYSFADSLVYLQGTQLTVTVVSAYTGCGVISSPSGYTAEFSFQPLVPTVLTLPTNLIHINDQGKTEKGLLVHTTAPVNLVLHDYVQFGGDASQILPDPALDTAYVAFGWGIWNDVGEHNSTEFIVTAAQDSTFVTITPSVRTELNQAASVPFTIILNRGECYIVKADITDLPFDPSLSGSLIHATKPVSVVDGLTCAYNPLQVEACNELMDELIGKKWWGSHFYTQPIDMYDSGGMLVLTSNQDFSARINGNVLNSTRGRLSTTFIGPIEVHTFNGLGQPVPVEAQQLTRSYSFADSLNGDPSLVSLLDTAYYTDTLLWNTPSYEFQHSVPIICPTADLPRATLDGTPLSAIAPSKVINGSRFSAIDPPVVPGEHRIISPDPVFAISAGFFDADAYTFIAGTAGTPSPKNPVNHTIIYTSDSARSCSDFNVNASIVPPLQDSEGVVSLTLTVVYDPSAMHLVAIEPMSTLLNATYTVDTSTSGVIIITVTGNTIINGSNLFRLIFEGWKATTITTVGRGTTSSCADDSELITLNPVDFAISPSGDTTRRQFILTNTTASLCKTTTLALNTDSLVLPLDGLVISKIQILYNDSTEQVQGSSSGRLLAGTRDSIYQLTGDYEFFVTPPSQVSGSDSVLIVQINPLKSSTADTVRARIFYLECGDTLERDAVVIFPIANSTSTISTPLSIPFDSIATCLEHDSVVIVWDSGCAPITLTAATLSGSYWTLLGVNQKILPLPIPLPGNAGYPLLLRFHPRDQTAEEDSLVLTFQSSQDSTFKRTILLRGSGRAAGTLSYEQTVNFGNVSLCLPIDSSIRVSNQTCDTAIVERVRVSSPYTLANTLPLTLPVGASGKLQFRYAPNAAEADTGSAIVTFALGDSTFTDTLSLFGTGKGQGTVLVPQTFSFGNASPCAPLPASVTIYNRTCKPATIDSIITSAPFSVKGNLPITIVANSSAGIPLEFSPDSIAGDTGTAIVVLDQNGTTVYDTIKLTGAGKASGTLQYSGGSSLDFGAVSLCSHTDEILGFHNTSCDSASIDSIAVLAPYSVAGTLPFLIRGGADTGVSVRFTPTRTTADTGKAIVFVTVNGVRQIDTIIFTGAGISGNATLATTAPGNSISSSHVDCDTADTSAFWLYNPGCDTLWFASGFSVLSTGGGSSWSTTPGSTTDLPPLDSVLVTLVSHNRNDGNYSGLFQTSYLDTNGKPRIFTVNLQESITSSPRTLAIDTSPVILSTVLPCNTEDTIIPYTNTSCLTDTFIGWRMLHYGDGFQVYNIASRPVPIPPGATDSLTLSFDGSHTGTIYDTIVIIVGTDNDSVRRIPIQIYVPPVDTLHFVLQMPQILSEKELFPVNIYPDREVAGTDLTSIAGRFSWIDKDFIFGNRITAAPGLTLTYNGPRRNGTTDVIDYAVSNAKGVSLDTATPMVQVWLESTLTDTINYAVMLDSLMLDNGNAQFADCILASATTGAGTDTAKFLAQCGDSLIIEELQNQPLIFASDPAPNPLTEENAFTTVLTLQSPVSGEAAIEIVDAIGRTVSRQILSLLPGTHTPCILNLQSSPAGSYFYTVRYTSMLGTTTRNGSVVVIR